MLLHPPQWESRDAFVEIDSNSYYKLCDSVAQTLAIVRRALLMGSS